MNTSNTKDNYTKNIYPLNNLSKVRWSPRAFDNKMVENEKICRLFEAARWAPSAFNEQPWRFIYGIKGDASYKKIEETLVEFNQKWTKTAPLLILNITRKTFTLNEVANTTCDYDLGQAVAHLSLEASEIGLHVHQMSGFDPKKAQKLFNIPENFHAVSVMAIGYIGRPEILPEEIAEMEYRERERNDFHDFVFTEDFGKTTTLF